MPFSHYPKTPDTCITTILWYGPDDPRNNPATPLGPGEEICRYLSSVNFTRFFATIYADQPLEITFSFSGEDRLPAALYPLPEEYRPHFPVDAQGLRDITDPDLPHLHYDATAQVVNYKPGPPTVGDKVLVTIYGPWLRIKAVNVGNERLKACRIYVHANVF